MLLKQSKVPCLADNSARLALAEENPYEIQTKPHGHGDVHSLLHASGTARRWARQGFEWVVFFQDTNALVFRGLLPSLGAHCLCFYIHEKDTPQKYWAAAFAWCAHC